MKLRIVSIALLLTSFLGVSASADGREPPVAKLVQINGNVEYSRNGNTWRPVRRTKYLFAGYHIKTGTDGSGKLINQKSGMSQDLGPNSQISVESAKIALVSGTLSKPKAESASVFQGLANKFAKAQRYTTVRRSVTTADDQVCDNKVRTIRKVSLSPAHPDLVWRNACPEFSYRVIIDDMSYNVSAESNSEMIRFTVKDVKPGEHTYRVEVLDGGDIVYSPRKDSSFTWIDRRAEDKIMKELKSAGDDVFVSTNILESKDMHVAAMDAYRTYFDENPDDNDMRPLLIQTYQELKLNDLRENEARLYNASLEEDF